MGIVDPKIYPTFILLLVSENIFHLTGYVTPKTFLKCNGGVIGGLFASNLPQFTLLVVVGEEQVPVTDLKTKLRLKLHLKVPN